MNEITRIQTENKFLGTISPESLSKSMSQLPDPNNYYPNEYVCLIEEPYPNELAIISPDDRESFQLAINRKTHRLIFKKAEYVINHSYRTKAWIYTNNIPVIGFPDRIRTNNNARG